MPDYKAGNDTNKCTQNDWRVFGVTLGRTIGGNVVQSKVTRATDTQEIAPAHQCNRLHHVGASDLAQRAVSIRNRGDLIHPDTRSSGGTQQTHRVAAAHATHERRARFGLRDLDRFLAGALQRAREDQLQTTPLGCKRNRRGEGEKWSGYTRDGHLCASKVQSIT